MTYKIKKISAKIKEHLRKNKWKKFCAENNISDPDWNMIWHKFTSQMVERDVWGWWKNQEPEIRTQFFFSWTNTWLD